MPKDTSSSRHTRNAPRTRVPVPRSLNASSEGHSLKPTTGPDLSEVDLFLFNEGSHTRLYEKMGCHLTPDGATFRVWAPNAEYVAVVGEFNAWDPAANPLELRATSGIWEGFIGGVADGAVYKFHIGTGGGATVEKADPYGFWAEEPPKSASRAATLDYSWTDDAWMAERSDLHEEPMSIYEVHLGSWMRDDDGSPLSYRDLAPHLIEHVTNLNFTHVEFLPVMEHPFAGSWGYQTLGFFSPTARFGSPQDFMFLIDSLHQAGIGVILDWVPSHFAVDGHGLASFDGTHLYEHADPRQGFHPDWGTFIFNYSRDEVRSFLLSSAFFWLDKFHVDGLRVDAVASMLYLDYSREDGEWIPNEFGGNENIDAIWFLRRLNEEVYGNFPGVQMIAEESTAWPMVSGPTYVGGLGFGFKWDMGWMHDTLSYLANEPVHRSHHHNEITFRSVYAFTENYLLPLSHDEVVHEKGSLLEKMPGDSWQQFANLRLLYSYQFALPGKKLLFMGGEIGQRSEWDHDGSVHWHLLDHESHRGSLRLVSDLGRIYRDEPALHQMDNKEAGYEWLEGGDWERSILAFVRKDAVGNPIVCVFNFTPVPRADLRVGVPNGGEWMEVFNSDASEYWGSGHHLNNSITAEAEPWHGRDQSVVLNLPPLAAVFLKPK